MDTIGAFEKVRDSYIDYVKTAFATQYPGLEAERERLLRKPGTICQEPWIEPVPQYQSSGKKIRDLTVEEMPGMSSHEIAAFQDLALCGLFGDYHLYTHQVDMLRAVLSGKSAVATAGTGSGKTEAFLLPLLAHLVRESGKWSRPGTRPEHQDDWWRNNDWQKKQKSAKQSPRVTQRGHENRDAAIRGLILYPMNALVEDQLSRLREALDSPAARDWFDDAREGNRFYFGRYNADTLIPGHELNPPAQGRQQRRPDQNRIDRLIRDLKETEAAANAADQITQDTGNQEVRYFFPRLDGAEMRSRWDMQDHPPDILITNFSMLSVMLMRDADDGIFEKTRKWLEKDDSVFHLVVDELHLHRGTAGTEVAYLVKLLLLRLGLAPGSPKLRVIGSSASLEPDNQASLDFLSQFFGFSWQNSQIIHGKPAAVELWDSSMGFLPTEPFVAIAKNPDDRVSATTELRQSTGINGDLEDILQSEQLQISARVLAACTEGETTKATSLANFGRSLFGNHCDEETVRAAIRGVLATRELCGPNTVFPSFRMHWFFKNIEGLWACTQPDCNVEPAEMTGGRTAGQLFTGVRILCNNPDEPHRVLDLLYCEQCGTTMFGGSRFELPDGQGWELLITDADIEGLPDRQAARFVDRRRYSEFAVFWPSGDKELNPDAKGQWRQPALDGGTVPARWRKASLNPATGSVKLGNTEPVSGYAFVLVNPGEKETSALPAICPLCSADYGRRRYRKSPVRGFRTGFARVTQILSKEMFYFLPEDARKLVAFSDSRQDAAELANGIERTHYSDLVREAMYDELRKAAVGEPALLSDLQAAGRPVTPEAIRLAQYHPKLQDHYQKLFEWANVSNSDLDNFPDAVREELKKDVAKNRAELESVSHRGLNHTVPLRLLFDNDPDQRDRPGALIRRLKALGVNPAGQDVLYQAFSYDNDYRRWTTLFNFEPTEDGWKPGLSQAGRERGMIKLMDKVTSEICAVLFARSYFGFESSGLGYATLELPDGYLERAANACGISQESLASILNGSLRMLGDYYRYRQENQNDYPDPRDWPDWNPPTRAAFRRFVEKCASIHGVDKDTLLETVREAICNVGGHYNFQIAPRRLLVRVALPDDPVWHCPGCRRPHLYNPGICTGAFCQRELAYTHDATCTSLHERNYYAKEAAELRQPVRLHAEELTAQTDDQAERQRLFRKIIVDLRNDPKHPLVEAVDEIDLLSVTTTMEVGVDIGNLQGVIQGNMPPQRFNYQQRAGRAGRRGQPFATVLTICRGRSHDEFYYQNLDRITGDPPPAPFLSMGRHEIAQRLMAKECLRRAFREAGVHWSEVAHPPDSHGEMGLASKWKDSRREAVRNWLDKSPDADDIANALCAGLNASILPSDLVNYARRELFDKIDQACVDPEITGDGLAERLAEYAVLPMYGMPSRMRLLYHGLSDRDTLNIDRDLDLAVTEFAPGSQRTKDKRVHRAIGFTAQIYRQDRRNWISAGDPLPTRRWMQRCGKCHYTKTSDTEPPDTSCPQCGCGHGDDPAFRKFQIAVPLAFRTDLDRGEDSQEDVEFLPTGVATLSESDPQPCSPVTGTNSAIAFSKSGRLYRVNDRAGQFFTGTTGTAQLPRRQARLSNQWIDERFQKEVNFEPAAAAESIAIVAPKTTDVLRICHQAIHPGLLLDPAEAAGIKAAYYSAAFIIKAAAAEQLDIDPDEFDISNVRQVKLCNSTQIGEITIGDHLANGAGFTQWIHDNWKNLLAATIADKATSKSSVAGTILNQEHQASCDSSCYVCLRNYRNMPYHGLLDWRLGVSLLRSLSSNAFACGLDGNFSSPDLAQWPEQAIKLRDAFCVAFRAAQPRDFGMLPGLVINNKQVLVVHPFWNLGQPQGLLAEAISNCGQESPQTLDTFDLLRRQGWAYQSLGRRA